jgi:GMP synthase (glutamine-hydrolysing)
MKSALAVRHVPFEDLGVLEPFLRRQGYDVRYIDACTDDLSAIDAAAADLLVVLGGPIGAYDEEVYPFLTAELELVRARLAADKPLLGVCLGAQIMARVLGAKVGPMGVKEIGFSPLTLTEAGRASPLALLGDAPVLHWHGDQFDIPAGAERLAYTDICPNQAFAVGRNTLGLQFHLEADPAKLERWLVGHACELGSAGIDPREIRAQIAAHGPALTALASQIVGRWLAEAGA